MATKNDNRHSFTCYNCGQVTFYNISDYIEEKDKTLLLEMVVCKKKNVSINCSNIKCRCINIVTITYL